MHTLLILALQPMTESKMIAEFRILACAVIPGKYALLKHIDIQIQLPEANQSGIPEIKLVETL